MTEMRHGALDRRQLSSSDSDGKKKAVIIVVTIAAVLILAVIVFFVHRRLRRPRTAETQGRTKRISWRERLAAPFRRRGHPDHRTLPTAEVQDISRSTDNGVDRHQSIRSVATLPAYSAVPRDGEGVIGREGDREGMDTVVEFPETAEEEEERREEEMEALFRIRQQRRQEQADREDRRRRRREARARNDTAALNAIRHESLLRTTYRQDNGSTAMVAAHQARPRRDRRVSAVSYGDLGVARHDGSRVRGNSTESDSRPLLDGASSNGMSGPIQPWLSRDSLGTHHRMNSSTSVASASSIDSSDREDYEVISLQATRSRAHSRAQSLSTSLHLVSTPPATMTDVDLADHPIPPPDPPHYDTMGFEEAPPYEPPETTRSSQSSDQSTGQDLELGQVQPQARPRSQPQIEEQQDFDTSRAAGTPTPPQLPSIDRLPSIRITSAVSPIDPQSRSWSPRSPTLHEETN